MSSNTSQNIVFLTQLNIKKLKNIKDLSMSFNENKRLVAIFGENGCGKSTILYALACVFQNIKRKNGKKVIHTIGENYIFPDFFPTTSYNNTYNKWEGSELEISYLEQNEIKSKVYTKKDDRWTRYDRRPSREVYFLGIGICVPQIELETKKSNIKMEQDKDSSLKEQVRNDIEIVMGKKYDNISFVNNKKYKLAEIKNISYPSIFMGAGESKVIEILRTLHSAGKNSLILIDELDLTLHTFALKKLLEVMIRISEDKKLQIIFTTHREEISEFKKIRDKLDIKYITNRLSDQTECLNNITSEDYFYLTGDDITKNIIYVEDRISQAIVEEFLTQNNLYDNTKIVIYGAITNAFTIACGLYLSNPEDFYKHLFVLDGDRYQSQEEKMEQIKKKLTGTEADIEEKRQKVLEKIIQYNPSNSYSPEKFIFDTIMELDECPEKLMLEKQNLKNISGDNHHLFPPEMRKVTRIISKFSEQPIWDNYTSELKEKLLDKQDE